MRKTDEVAGKTAYRTMHIRSPIKLILKVTSCQWRNYVRNARRQAVSRHSRSIPSSIYSSR